MNLQNSFPQYEALGDQWRARLLGAILYLGIPISIALLIVTFLAEPGFSLDVLLATATVFLEVMVWFIWIRWGLNQACTLLVVGASALSAISILYSGGLASITLSAEGLVIVVSALLTTPRFAFALVVAATAFNFVLIFGSDGRLVSDPLLNDEPLIRFSLLTAILVITAGTILYSNKIMQALTKQLANSEYRFRALFEKTSDAVFITGLDLNLLEVNKQAAKMLSYEPKELIGLPVKKLFPADEWKQVKERFETVKKDEFLEPTMRRFVAKTGKELILETNLSLVQDSGGNPLHYQSTGRDVTHKVHEERRLQLKASTDSLTGVLNRETILQHAEAELERAVREQQPLGLMLVDMDELKKINDTYGHLAGDRALITVAEVINAHKRRYDSVGRFGGDEFIIVLPGARSADALAISQRMEGEISRRFVQTDKGAVLLSCAFGVASTDDQDSKIRSVNELIELADRSLYKTKRGEK